MSLRVGRCGLLLGAITAIALLPDCGGKVSTATAEGPTGEVEASVSGECTAELESIAPAGGQKNPALGATLVAKAASCMRATPARYRFIAKSPNTGTSLVACDWQLGRTCRWNTSALAERGLWMVQVETSRDGQAVIDGRSAATRYAVGGVCRTASVASVSPASATVEPGSNVSVTVSATCDAGVTPQYAVFATGPTGASTQVGAWSSSAGPFTWSTTGLAQGRYTLEARVRQAGSTVDYEASATSSYTLGRYVCDAPVVTAATSGSTRAVAVTGVSCTSGAVTQARFTLKSPTGSTSLLQDWSATTSHNWNVAGLDGTWRVLVEVRAQQTPTQAIGSTTVRAALGAACTATPSAPIAGASPIVRTAGVTVPLTATESGCTPEFKYQVNGFAGWTTVCDWSTSASCSFDSSTYAAGSYAVRTLVRKSGSTDIDYEAVSSPLTLILDANQDGDAYSISQGDCHDGNAAVHPGAAETCNDLDDNCNGTVDEGVSSTYYVDADGDGYGDPAGALKSCSALSGFVSTSTDCDDTVASVHPGTGEICGNAVDENCDGLAPACTTVCTPSSTTCSGSTLTTCSADGTSKTTSTCALGCGATACAHITPSNLPADICVVAGTNDLASTATTTVNTSGTCDMVVVQGNGAPDICVLKYRTVSNFGTMYVTGTRALAIVATESMKTVGAIYGNGKNEIAGAGATETLGAPSAYYSGAGAGHSTAGATAGSVAGYPPSAAGAAYGSPDGIPLIGGARGGSRGGAGGGGGSAVQLVSCGTMTFPGGSELGAVVVGGGGGRGGQPVENGSAGGGGGGGSGGTALLEAAHFIVPANPRMQLQAYGGAGGGGGGLTFSGGDANVGGNIAGDGGDGGGDGGASTIVDGDPHRGGDGMSGVDYYTGRSYYGGAGGGAGAAGFVRMNSLDGASFNASVLDNSPWATVGTIRTN